MKRFSLDLFSFPNESHLNSFAEIKQKSKQFMKTTTTTTTTRKMTTTTTMMITIIMKTTEAMTAHATTPMTASTRTKM